MATLVVAATLFAGCNATSGGLSNQLPAGGGGGSLSFAGLNGTFKSTMVDAVAGRSYSKIAVTSVQNKGTTGYPASPATASGTAPITCSVIAGTAPAGLTIATGGVSGAGCLVSGKPTTAGQYTFTLQAEDSNSPPGIAQEQVTLNVRPEFVATPTGAAVSLSPLPAGVQGRSYGVINPSAMQVTTNLGQTTVVGGVTMPYGNGPIAAGTNYCTATATPAIPALSVNLASSGTNNNCLLQDSGALASGPYKVTVSLTDTPIKDPETNLQAVPANTINALSSVALAVGSPLHVAANTDAVSSTPPNGVQGRAYGTGASCSGGACLPLTYLASGGLPSVEAADSYTFTTSAALAATGVSCAGSATAAVAKTTCISASATAGSATFAVTVDDPGNLATPSGSVSGTTNAVSGLSLTVNPALNLAVIPDPAANPAVQNRAYGTGSGCSGAGGGCAAPTYTPSGGLGSYTFNLTGAAPAGIDCAPNAASTADVCSGTASSTAATSTFGVAASDTANASTPSGATSPISKTLTVDTPIVLTAPVSVPAAVNLRAFGTGAGCTAGNCVPATFSVSGGLGGYSPNATVVSAPGTWLCPLTGASYNCSSGSVVSGTPNLSVTASDTGNAATPGASTVAGAASVAVAVNPQMTLAPPASVPDAVTGRAFGTGPGCTGGACATINYGIAGGLGNYTAGTMSIQGDGADNIACSVVAATYSCSTGTINGGTLNAASVTVTANETGNASTPAGSTQDSSRTMNIRGKIVLTPSLGAAWPSGVQNRSYAAGATQDTFTAANGIPPYIFPATTPGSFPGGFSCPAVLGAVYTCSSPSVTATGAFSPQVAVADTGNASTPASTLATDPGSRVTSTVTINAPLQVTLTQTGNGTPTNPANLLDGVAARSYGVVGAVPTYTGAGGLGAASYEWCVSSGTLPSGFTGVSASCAAPTVAPSATITASPASAAGASAFTVRLDDAGNATTPGSAASTTSSPISTNITIQPALSATLTQNGVVNPAALLDGAINRSYGMIGAPPTYNGAGGISGAGGSNYAWCMTLTPTLPGSAPTGFLGPSATCPGTVPGTAVALTNSQVNGVANSLTVAVRLDDQGNAATPGSNASGTFATKQASLLIHPQLGITAAPASIPDAVNGRTYGTPGAGTDLVYTVPPTNTIQAGVGTITLAPIGLPASTGAGFPMPLACSQTAPPPPSLSPTLTCNSTNLAVTSAAATFHPTVTVTDAGDAATPPGNAQSQLPLIVDAPLLAKLTQTGNPTPTNPTNLLDGVLGRSYGVTGAAGAPGAPATPTYTAAGGLGASNPGLYQWCISAGSLPTGFIGVSANCATPTIAASPTLTANPANGAGASAFTVRLDDAGNATTPGSVASGTSSPNSTNITIQSALSATLTQNGVVNPATLLDGVLHRSYGTINGGAGAPTYTATGGLQTSYEWCATNAPAGFNSLTTCPAYTPGTTAVLTAPTLAGPPANIANVQVQVDDTGNAAVPPSATSGASGVRSASLVVHPQIAITATPNAIPDAVTGRTYGKPNGTEDLVYSAPESNSIEPGLAPVTLTPTGLPVPIACNSTSSTPPTVTCNSANAVVTAVAGSTITVTGTDTANAATPAATTASDPGSQLALPINVDAALAISTTTLPNALLNYPYPTVTNGATVAATGGLGGNTWFGPGSTTSGGCPASLTGATNFGNIGFALNSTTTNATITGTPSAASSSAGQYAFQVCVIDSANGTTPAGDALPATTNTDPTTLAIDVMTPYAVIAEPGANAVDFFDTSALSDGTPPTPTMQPVSTGAGTAPYAVAFSPSGRYAYVTLSGNNKLAVFDTITNEQITSPSSPIALTGCTTPHGVAATATEIFVACNGSGNVVVLSATTLSATPLATFTLAGGTLPEGVAVRADGLRAYVTLSGTNQVFVIDNSNPASPAALATTTDFPNNPATLPTASNGSIPFGIVLAPIGSDTRAYIAKQKSAADTTDSVEVLTITSATDAIADATNVSMSAAGTAQPTFLALTPDNKRVYVTLPGTDQFAVFDNTQTPPVQLSATLPTPSSPYTLATAAAAPTGVAIPVLSPVPVSTGYLVFISENATNGLGIVDNLTPPAEDAASPKALSATGSGPAAMASTPAPQ